MRNVLTIARYEYKIQIINKVLWVVLLVTSIMSIYEQFPSIENLNRLEQLTNHGYIADRALTLTGIFLMLAVVFVVGKRIIIDMEHKTIEILFSLPIRKSSYILGKFLGNFLISITHFAIFIGVNAVVQAIFNPSPFEVYPYIFSFVFIVIPTMIFVVGLSIGIPVLIDVRLFYVIMSIYFLYCIFIIPNSYEIPFYWVIGDIRKLLYSNFHVPYRSAIFNIIFLVGTGLCSVIILCLSSKYLWREE